ncbi:unnamed protein product [Fraxinus pennsylvanica]|uniref:Uncharacterized protein n=1 Tax=Fraxinus pennsylvanica TaxID=56036 RepID=A0AAD1YMV4_9LAMI|nr:unnamed protein product [Fraxinus pennsylvanica]
MTRLQRQPPQRHLGLHGHAHGTSHSRNYLPNHNGVFGFGFSRVNEASFVQRWKANEGVRTKLFVLIEVGGDESEVLGGDDLVSVNVVAHNVAEPVECSDGGSGVGGGCGGTERASDAVVRL